LIWTCLCNDRLWLLLLHGTWCWRWLLCGFGLWWLYLQFEPDLFNLELDLFADCRSLILNMGNRCFCKLFAILVLALALGIFLEICILYEK
jgi:hypothetical protein